MNLDLNKDQAQALRLTLRDVIEIERGNVLLEPVLAKLDRFVGRPVAEPIPIGEHRGPRAIYASDACRARHWKERTGYIHPRDENARNARKRASGFQVSYPKALERTEQAVRDGRRLLGMSPREIAERRVREALSPRQKALLEQRSKEAVNG